MNLRTTLIAAAVTAALVAPGAASAITVDGISFSPGAALQTVTLWEGNSTNGGIITGVGDVLSGVGRVAIIQDGSGNAAWTWGGSGSHELSIYFTNFTVASVITAAPGMTMFGFTGGSVQLWSDASGDSDPDFDPGAGETPATAAATFTNGNLWLDLVPQTMASGFTLMATQIGAQVIGQGYLNVVGGLAMDYFETDGYGAANTFGNLGLGATADVQFGSLGNIGALGNNTPWAFTGTANVSTFAIPEPGTLALLGAGLVGIGMRRRKLG